MLAFGLITGAASAASTLSAGQSLTTNTSLTSPNGKYTLYMQSDGNLVLYDVSGSGWMPRWATYAFGSNLRAVMQHDGNFVVYDAANTPKWSSGTAGFSGGSAYLQLQDDGNLVIYRDGLPVWNPGGFLGDTLTVGSTMKPGAIRRSRNGRYQLQMQSDGNFVLYDTSNWSPTWATYAFGSDLRAVMQTDGNLVVYDGSNTAKWDAHTNGFDGADLRVQDDGNLVIVRDDLPVWARGTFIGNQMYPNHTLRVGAIRRSANGRFQLQMQTDGNLVLYDTSTSPWSPRWATYAYGSNLRAQMQTDGNFVVYDPSNTPRWYTGTNGHDGARLEVQNNGHLLVVENGNAIWVDDRSSWRYGGDDGAVNTPGEADQFIADFRGAADDGAALNLYNALSTADRGVVDGRLAATATSLTLGRDVQTRDHWLYRDGLRTPVSIDELPDEQSWYGRPSRTTSGALGRIGLEVAADPDEPTDDAVDRLSDPTDSIDFFEDPTVATASSAYGPKRVVLQLASSAEWPASDRWATVRNANGAFMIGNLSDGDKATLDYKSGAAHYGGYMYGPIGGKCGWIVAKKSRIDILGSASSSPCNGAKMRTSAFAARVNLDRRVRNATTGKIQLRGGLTRVIVQRDNTPMYANVRPWAVPAQVQPDTFRQTYDRGDCLEWRYVSKDGKYVAVLDRSVDNDKGSWGFIRLDALEKTVKQLPENGPGC